MEKAIRILIVDDHTVLRHGLHLMLELKPGLEVVGEARDGVDAISQARLLQPDVILMDLEMPRMGGQQAIQEIHNEFPAINILVLTSFADNDKIMQAIKAGAAGYLLKDASPADLVQSIKNVFAGNVSLSPEITKKLVQQMQQPPANRQAEQSLTEREREILRLAASGLSNQDIARRLVIAEGTVRFHLSNIFSKFQVSNRSQALLHALRLGWVDLKDSEPL
jgi:DNA-binding NarL/FixJ family response regulator